MKIGRITDRQSTIDFQRFVAQRICTYVYSVENAARVAKLSTDEMAVEKVWTLPVQRHSYGNGFVVCGILYLVRDTRVKTTSIDYAYDMYSEQPVDGVKLSFTNPFEMNNMIAYNPAEKTIYSWDKGNQLVYRLLM